MRKMRQFRRPRKAELLIISAAILSIVSAVFAVHFWIRRGVCTDMVVCTTIAVLSLIGLILLLNRMRNVTRTRELSERPVLLVMKSGPRKSKEEDRKIRGKMPDELNH